MARPKEKESSACNLKLEVGAKARLTELAEHSHTSRTKIVEDLVNQRYEAVFSSTTVKADAVSQLAAQLLSAGVDTLHATVGTNIQADRPKQGAPAASGSRRGSPTQSTKR